MERTFVLACINAFYGNFYRRPDLDPISGAFMGGLLLAGVMCTPVSHDAKKAAGLCAALLTGYGLYALAGPF